VENSCECSYEPSGSIKKFVVSQVVLSSIVVHPSNHSFIHSQKLPAHAINLLSEHSVVLKLTSEKVFVNYKWHLIGSEYGYVVVCECDGSLGFPRTRSFNLLPKYLLSGIIESRSSCYEPHTESKWVLVSSSASQKHMNMASNADHNVTQFLLYFLS
jgi:hypothetical protein